MLHGRMLQLSGLLALVLSSPFAVNASQASFAKAYSDYQAAVEQGDAPSIEASAKVAYELGATQFAKDSIEVANLALNWASALEKTLTGPLLAPHNQTSTAEINALYQQALTSYKHHYAKSAIELIDPLLGAALTEPNATVAKNYLQQAVDIAEKSQHKKLLADIKMTAFHRLANTELYTPRIKNFALEALESYVQILPENALDRVKATYTVGAIEFAEKHYLKAEPLFLEVIKQFDALEYTHPYALSAHAYLVDIYERKNKREQATAHCLAIGKMRPWTDTQEQQPIFRTLPDYPMSYIKAGKSGWVNLTFTVDEQGFVKDPEIIASEGGSLFEKESLKTLSKWRYAPKFEHGKAIAAKTSVRMDYTINR
ncbi:MAG: TonB family protein [Shewanella sp.]|uniref:TonB family protein n=1 Tax=Shewanella sp. TaxID=50422 RepID=UPI003F31EF86